MVFWLFQKIQRSEACRQEMCLDDFLSLNYIYVLCLYTYMFVCLFVVVFFGKMRTIWLFTYNLWRACSWNMRNSGLRALGLSTMGKVCCSNMNKYTRSESLSWCHCHNMIHILIYIPRTQMTIVLLGISALFWGLDFKTRGHEGALGIWLPFSCINFRMNYYIATDFHRGWTGL